jgi:CheY-like chemotaxis protein
LSGTDPAAEAAALPRGLSARLTPATALAQDLAGAGGKNGTNGRPLALIIDDERSFRVALTRYFERCGWDVEEAEDGKEALELLERPAASAYKLVITDLRMPGCTGLEVHDWMAKHRPGLFDRLIIATGDVVSPEIREFIGRTPRPVLEKPFELSTLAALVARVTAD